MSEQKFSSALAQLLATEIVGNHAADYHLINALSHFIYKSDNFEEQVIAFKFMSENVMGFPPVEITAEMIKEANLQYKEFYIGE